jgi:photosystem II stability/assembly factor-like uncharacterized protein
MIKLKGYAYSRIPFLLMSLLCLHAGCKKDLLHWDKVQQLESHTTHRLNRIFFVDNTTGFVIGGDRFNQADMLITRDGGKSWSYRTFPEAAKGLYGITQSPDGTVYVLGFDGKLLFSADTGNTWSFRQLDYLPLKQLAFTRPGEGIVIGGISFDQGFRLGIDGEGQRQSRDSFGYELNDIRMLNAYTGYISGYGVVLKTSDGGQSWDFMRVEGDNFTALDGHDENRVWVCGYEGSIYKTADGGRTWDRLRNGNDLTRKKYRLLDILFLDEQRGYAVGEEGAVIYTEDGGRHWMEFDRFTEHTLRSIAVAPDGSLLVAGDNGTFYRLRP